MPPFQSEGQERKRVYKRCEPSASVSRVPFAAEGEETFKGSNQPKHKRLKPFCDEASEESASDPEEYVPKEKLASTFALGWQTLESFSKATAWSKNSKEEETRKKAEAKRTYNNQNRATAAAKNQNRRSSGVFANRGADPERVASLIAKKCDCASATFPTHTQGICSELCSKVIAFREGANQKCFSQFQQKELATLLKKFWGLSKPEQDHLALTLPLLLWT